MAKMYYGSLNFTDLLEAAKSAHSAFVRAGERQKIYVDVQVWINDEPDKYGNLVAIKVKSKKDADDKSFYIGNLKLSEVKEGVALMPGDNDNDLPF